MVERGGFGTTTTTTTIADADADAAAATAIAGGMPPLSLPPFRLALPAGAQHPRGINPARRGARWRHNGWPDRKKSLMLRTDRLPHERRIRRHFRDDNLDLDPKISVLSLISVLYVHWLNVRERNVR